MRFTARRPGRSRRGLTLIEMLVTVVLLILIMTIIAQIFQSATGAISVSRTYEGLDQNLRRLDSTIRQDLNGVTARLTPPLDPKDDLGYLEYTENAFADNQGEDTDDIIRFTTRAPEGHPFTGRVWVAGATNTAIQPILVTSQYAEVIYFLRNGNLYRRVLLVAPERQSSVRFGNEPGTIGGYNYKGIDVSWQGMNDLSARSVPPTIAGGSLILNTLGDLTNRENRAFSPRFANDYRDPGDIDGDGNTNEPDGIPDDTNSNGVPDFYPTLYPLLFNGTTLINEGADTTPSRTTSTYADKPFPFIFPGAYSRPALETVNSVQGWIHGLDPSVNSNALTNNHAPLEQGESAGVNPPGDSDTAAAGIQSQTWWGLPTWRETAAPGWVDPFRAGAAQSWGLVPFNPTANPGPASALLPAVAPLPYTDGAGGTTIAVDPNLWDDDLIMSGVRSFDIKAYDNSFVGYVDLGWGDDRRTYTPYGTAPSPLPFLTATPTSVQWPPSAGNPSHNTLSNTYAHEGRIPPLVADQRADPQSTTFNVGDDQVGVIRLRRVWDSWSTAYTHAPATGVDVVTDPSTKKPLGPPFSRPVYPSYPPPYPMPLRGVQIQIRVVDPKSERIKVLTIRQDFSNKL